MTTPYRQLISIAQTNTSRLRPKALIIKPITIYILS